MKARLAAWSGILILLAIIAAVIVVKGPLGRRAEVAAGYSARVTCACRYVANRSLASCLTDLEPGTEIARVTDDPAARRVTASVPLLARRSATADGLNGCRLD